MLPLCALAVLVCAAFAADPSINVNDNSMEFTVAGASLKLTSNCSALPVQPTATEAFVNAAASGIRDNLAIAVAAQASATGASVAGLAAAQGSQVASLAGLVGQAIANVAALQATTLTQGAVDSALSSASSTLAVQAASALASAASTAQAQAPVITALAASAAQTAAVITALQNVTGPTFDRLVTATQVSTQVAAVRTELSNTVTAQQAATVTAITSTLTATATGITSVVAGMDSRVAALTAAQSTLDSRLTDSNTVVEQIRQSVSTTQSQVVAATTRVTTLEGLVTGLSGLVVAVNSNASVQIQQTQNMINSETTRATGVEAAISTVATQISTRVSTVQANVLSFTNCLTQGLAVNSSFACVTSVNMCNPSVLGQTRYTTTMEYCDGTNWVAIPTGIGRSSVVPAYSCRQIYTLDNTAISGVYWLTGSSTTAWQAYCDMTDGGYTLVGMVASTDDDTWAYNGGLWTNAATLNDATTDPNTNVHFKSRFFNTMPFGTIKFVMNTITGTPMRYNANYPSAASFFSAGTLGSSYGRGTWIANVGVTSSFFDNEPNCNAEGVSFTISGNGGSSTGCRFGITMNNENDCLTNDAVIGFGCYYSYTGTTNMGCGAISWNPTNRYPKRGWIWVK